MTDPNTAPDANIEDAVVPGFPKTIRPYRRKIRASAVQIASALRGVPELPQGAQVKVLKAVVAELRKMTAGAVKALEIAEGRDYEAYKAAKQAAIEGKLTKAEQSKFDSLVAGLGDDGEYQFAWEDQDEVGNEAMDKLTGETSEG